MVAPSKTIEPLIPATPASDRTGLHPRMTGPDPTVEGIAGIPHLESVRPDSRDDGRQQPRFTGRTRPQTTVVGVFDDRRDARLAVEHLQSRGFEGKQIGVVSRDEEDRTPAEPHDYAGEGAVAGAVTGIGVGGLWAVGIAAGVLPAIGPALAGGALASILLSAATAGTAGSLLGALIGIGIPEDEARNYETHVSAGRTIVTVQDEGRFSEAASILRDHGGSINVEDTESIR